jgi:hypothetical protein
VLPRHVVFLLFLRFQIDEILALQRDLEPTLMPL